MTSDAELLRRYAEANSEEAFAELVRRHHVTFRPASAGRDPAEARRQVREQNIENMDAANQVDAPPTDPLMTWDFDVTSGFDERTVSWRGNGPPEQDEFSPKVFNLSAGAHKLIVVGREPGLLRSVSIHAVAK